MRNQQKWIALLLCVTVLLSLVGCGKETASGTENTEKTTEPTVQETPAADLYTGAKAAVLAMNDVELETEHTIVRTIGIESFTTRSLQTATFHGRGTDTMTAQVEDSTEYGPTTVKSQDYFADGVGYTSIEGTPFFCAMTGEEFSDGYLPTVLLDETLYPSITAEDIPSGKKLTFSGSSSPEKWISPLGGEYAEMGEISGTAILDEAGNLTKTTCELTYTVGGMEVTETASVSVHEPGEAADVSGKVTELKETALEIPELYLPGALISAQMDLEQASSITLNEQYYTVSQAAGAVTTETIDHNFYGLDQDFSCHSDGAYSLVSSDGSSDSYTYQHDYLDGVYTFTSDGEEPEDSDLSGMTVRSNLLYLSESYIPFPSDLASLDVEYTPSNILISYTLTEDYAQACQDQICLNLFDDPDLLNNMASAYETKEASGYVSLDLVTMLPVAISTTYEGVHTIEGAPYTLSERSTQSLFLGSDSAYEAIHGEPLPEEEPENKATPLFYHVTGDDGQEMWLLGTIHVGDERTAYLPKEIYDAFDASDALAVEFDIQDFEEQIKDDPELLTSVAGLYYYTDGTSIKDHLDQETYETVVTGLKATGNYDVSGMAEYMRPSFLASFFDNYVLRAGYMLSPEKGVDNLLLTRAKESDKEVLNVESGVSQIEMMANFSEEVQRELLTGSMSASSLEQIKNVQEIYEAWCQGDEEKVMTLIGQEYSDLAGEEQKIYQEYRQAMEIDRNQQMLEEAKEYLEGDQVVFFAVGLAHLITENGLVNTLKDAGYHVELVSFGANQ